MSLLARVIEALARQSLDPRLWELLLIENAKSHSCDHSLLSPLPCASKLMIEKKSGKVNAMAAAAQEISGKWVVFVDDDNLVATDYLESLLKLHREFPQIGVFSASISGIFKAAVPEWANDYLIYLAIRRVETPKWANCYPAPVGPIGAGMCVRADLYQEFAQLVINGNLSSGLGRTQGSLMAGTDDTVFMDIAFCSGYGCGEFPELKLEHVIPPERLTLDYISRLVRDVTYSHTILERMRRSGRIRIMRSFLKLLIDQILLCTERSYEIRAIKRSKAYGSWRGKLHMWKQQY